MARQTLSSVVIMIGLAVALVALLVNVWLPYRYTLAVATLIAVGIASVALWQIRNHRQRQEHFDRETGRRDEMLREGNERFSMLADNIPQLAWMAEARREHRLVQPTLVRLHRHNAHCDERLGLAQRASP
ncbi:MAG: hypothetical protein QM754_19025 [Tepidisphaeraceae bacterium]